MVAMLNFAVPLNPGWNASARPPTLTDVDDDLPPLFGVLIDDWGGRNAYDFSRNQVRLPAPFRHGGAPSALTATT